MSKALKQKAGLLETGYLRIHDLYSLLFGQVQLVPGLNPLLQDDLAVSADRKVHGFCTLGQFVRHFGIHVDSDGLGAFCCGCFCHSFPLLKIGWDARYFLELNQFNFLISDKNSRVGAVVVPLIGIDSKFRLFREQDCRTGHCWYGFCFVCACSAERWAGI